MSNNGYKKKQGAGAGRIQFLGLRPTTLENKYIVGSGVTTHSRFVQNALRNRASNNSQQKPCCFPGPPPPLPVQAPPCQWSQQGCIGCAVNDSWSLGSTVSLSDDGMTAVVGIPQYPNQAAPSYPLGKIRLFKFQSGAWTQTDEVVGTIAANNSATLGSAVAISGDGSTVIASEPALDTFSIAAPPPLGFVLVREGVVRIFSVDSAGNLTPFPNAGSPTILGDETQVAVRPFQGYALPTGTPNEYYKNFGDSIAINYDGTVIAASSTPFPYQKYISNQATRPGGGVQIYEKSAGTWSPTRWYMAPSAYAEQDGGSGATVFGRSLSLSKDGTTLAIGAPRYQQNPPQLPPVTRPYQSGSVVVVKKDPNTGWPSPGAPAGTLGYIIPLNATMPTPSWQLIQLPSPYERERFGGSVAINGDGTRIVTASHPWLCSSCEATPITRVWDFDPAQNTWNQVGQDIPAVTTISTATQINCAINESGSRILVGDKNSVGATCYELIDNTWTVVCYPIAGDNVASIDMDAGGSGAVLGMPSPSQLQNGGVSFYKLLNA